MQLYPPQILRGLTWDRTRAYAVTRRRLTGCAMTLPRASTTTLSSIRTVLGLNLPPRHEDVRRSGGNAPYIHNPQHYAGVRTSAHPVRFIYGKKDLRRPSHGIRRRSGRCGKRRILCPRRKSDPDFSVTKNPPLMPYVKSRYL